MIEALQNTLIDNYFVILFENVNIFIFKHIMRSPPFATSSCDVCECESGCTFKIIRME